MQKEKKQKHLFLEEPQAVSGASLQICRQLPLAGLGPFLLDPLSREFGRSTQSPRDRYKVFIKNCIFSLIRQFSELCAPVVALERITFRPFREL